MRVATDLARQGTKFQEMQQAVRLLGQLMNQAAQKRAKVGEEKAVAAVTANSMVKIHEQKKIKLNNRHAEKFWPETYTADRVDKKSFAVLGRGRDVLKCSGIRLIGETAAGMGCRLPRPGDRDE